MWGFSFMVILDLQVNIVSCGSPYLRLLLSIQMYSRDAVSQYWKIVFPKNHAVANCLPWRIVGQKCIILTNIRRQFDSAYFYKRQFYPKMRYKFSKSTFNHKSSFFIAGKTIPRIPAEMISNYQSHFTEYWLIHSTNVQGLIS